MVFALAAFAIGKHFYAVEVVSRAKKTPAETKDKWAVLGRIAGLFLIVTFFWSIFDQGSNTWVFLRTTTST